MWRLIERALPACIRAVGSQLVKLWLRALDIGVGLCDLRFIGRNLNIESLFAVLAVMRRRRP